MLVYGICIKKYQIFHLIFINDFLNIAVEGWDKITGIFQEFFHVKIISYKIEISDLFYPTPQIYLSFYDFIDYI